MLFGVLSLGDGTIHMYTRINSMKRRVSGADNVSESGLMPQFGRVHEVVCALVSLFL
jgi:hypothetical protein